MLWYPEPDTGPSSAQSWWQERSSQQLLTLVPPPRHPRWGLGAGGSFLPGICTPQSPHFTLCSLPLPILGARPVSPRPACLPGQIEESLRIYRGSWRLDLDIHHARGVNTLQIIGSCMTYQLVIKPLPGAVEEITAGLACLWLNYQSWYSPSVYCSIYIFAVQ